MCMCLREYMYMCMHLCRYTYLVHVLCFQAIAAWASWSGLTQTTGTPRQSTVDIGHLRYLC